MLKAITFFLLLSISILPNQADAQLSDFFYRSHFSDASAAKQNRQEAAGDISEINEQLNWGEACENFASDTDFGKWGQMIKKELENNSYPALMAGSKDLERFCPTYHRLAISEQHYVWVLILNAMAFYESSCDSKSKAQGPNGRLIGLLQLHVNKEQNYAPNCNRGDGKYPQGTFRCGLSMLNGQLHRTGILFSRKSYWDVLRPQSNGQQYLKIRKALMSFELCHH